MAKYNRRIVVRNTLTDLEVGIIFLENQGWELDPTVPDEAGGTLLGTLRDIRNRQTVTVSMRQEIRPVI